MAFTRYQGGLKPPHPDETHPRVWISDFFDRAVLANWHASAAPQQLTADWRGVIPVDGWNMDANDSIGDCGIAGMDHLQMALSAVNTGTYAPWGATTCTSLYETLGGYVPGNPNTDQGTNLQDNLGWWRKNPVNGLQLQAFGAVRPGTWNRAMRVALMRMFGPLYLGGMIQNAQETQFPGPWTWDPASSIAGGHCIIQVAELSVVDEVRDVSWGAAVPATTNFQASYLDSQGQGEMWVVITEESVDKAGNNPYGFNLAAMNEKLGSLINVGNPLKLPPKVV